MQRIRCLDLLITACLLVATVSKADTVTQPMRKFGLGDLLQVAISPDQQWMATSGSGGAFLWNFTNGTVVHRLEAHRTRVGALCFSPDSQVLLTGGLDRTIRAWDVVTGMELRSFTGHLGEVSDLSFAPDGQSFVSAGDNSARVWSVATGELLHTVAVTNGGMIRVKFTPDGNRLVTADLAFPSTNNVRLWDLATEQMIRSFNHRSIALGFTAGGQLVTAGEDAIVRVWDLETGQLIRPLMGASPLIMGLVAATNNSQVLAGCNNGHVITWDATTGDIAQQFFHEKITALVAVPGTNQILVAHAEKLVRLKNSQIGDNLRVFGGHTTSTTSGVGFSPDGRYVVSGGTEPLTRLWIRTNALPLWVFPGHGAGTEAVRFSPDGTRLLTTFGAPIYSAQLWNVQTAMVDREFFGHTSWLLDAKFSPDGQRIVTGAQDGTARLWDVATGAHLRTFNAPPGIWIRAVAISSNGLFLAGGGSDGIARLWNATNGQVVRTFELNAGSVISVAFSPANGDLLVAWEDGFLRTFDPMTGELKLDSITPAAFLEAAEYSPDGRFILGGEGWPFFTARLWDARTGAEIRVFAGHAAPVSSVAFNATGTSILTGADIVRLWSIADIAAQLEGERKPNGLELRWHGGTLQQTGPVDGPWNDVSNAVSPWLISTDQPAAFFRVKVPAE
ncbi:MAG TPA: WD40 repeat domain-containing protein [Verrucomicrobiae bacterium]|nr:WD40 repeat domain-containing protein [Verrucomicrobiae bacterium]